MNRWVEGWLKELVRTSERSFIVKEDLKLEDRIHGKLKGTGQIRR